MTSGVWPKDQGKTALYRFYDQADRLLYVGITGDPDVRWKTHARDRAETWWPLVVEKAVEWFERRIDAAGAEIAAIASEDPLHNLSRTSSPMLVSASGAVRICSEDWNSFEWVNTSELARRLVAAGIEKSMTRQRVMQLAESDKAWPIPRDEWRYLANMWLWPWEVVAPYFRNRDRRAQGTRRDLAGKPTTRGHALLEQAREHFGTDPFTRADLRKVTNLSEAGIAQNTLALVDQGLFRVIGERAKARKGGKPQLLYAVVFQSAPRPARPVPF